MFSLDKTEMTLRSNSKSSRLDKGERSSRLFSMRDQDRARQKRFTGPLKEAEKSLNEIDKTLKRLGGKITLKL